MHPLKVAVTLAVVAATNAAAQPSASPGVTRAVGFYDVVRERVVLVGGPGQARAADRDHVWTWTGARWERTTDPGPSARGTGGVAYDERRQLAIVTGGVRRTANDSAFESIAETWEGSLAGWRRITAPDIAPRDHQSLIYDPTRAAVLLFGGSSMQTQSERWPSDTWELGPAGWKRIATEGPAGRSRTALAYDAARKQIVLFGGVGETPAAGQPQTFFGDTWIWERGAWRRVATEGPRGRYAHGMVFDERAGVVLLYSGAAAHRDAPLLDMWQWNGVRWTEIPLTGPTPGFRYQPVMVYDRARGKTVLYGGLQGGDDTWEWDGRQWNEIRVSR